MWPTSDVRLYSELWEKNQDRHWAEIKKKLRWTPKMVYPKLCQSMTSFEQRKKQTSLAANKLGIDGGFFRHQSQTSLKRKGNIKLKTWTKTQYGRGIKKSMVHMICESCHNILKNAKRMNIRPLRGKFEGKGVRRYWRIRGCDRSFSWGSAPETNETSKYWNRTSDAPP